MLWAKSHAKTNGNIVINYLIFLFLKEHCSYSMSDPKIIITSNGPYEVRGNVSLQKEIMVPDEHGVPQKWEKDEKFETDETYWLCRCGHSRNKPFCDSSHRKIGFDGTETAENIPYKDQAVTFSGPDLEYQDVRVLCASARFCTRAGGIRKLVENPTGPESKDIAIQESFDCPAGKLVSINKETGEPMEPLLLRSIAVAEDPGRKVSGPLWVKGGIPIVSENGTEYEIRNRVALCRCGESRNKPFCDGSHIRTRFNDGHPGLG